MSTTTKALSAGITNPQSEPSPIEGLVFTERELQAAIEEYTRMELDWRTDTAYIEDGGPVVREDGRFVLSIKMEDFLPVLQSCIARIPEGHAS